MRSLWMLPRTRGACKGKPCGVKNIIPPAAIQDAMEKQMKAERERREAILRAEGEKKSTILVAEGKKQSAILDAEADKQAAILHAEAEKEKRIREAEGQAEAILKIQQANADGIRMIKDAGADQAVLQLKSLEAFAKAADGKATKIIIPSEIQSLAGLVTSVTEIAKKSELRIDLEKEYGIVLEGGGARGAYQIGVWKALREAGMKIKGVAGTSVGALNGALICMDDLGKAEEIWGNMTYSTVFNVDDSMIGKLKKFGVRSMKVTDAAAEFRRLFSDRGLDIARSKTSGRDGG